jgi:hypothetical protein
MFRPSDVRRVQTAFDDNLDPPYEAEIQLDGERLALRVIIMDPDDPALTVAQAIWPFDQSLDKSVKQPADAEIASIVEVQKQICVDYPARKAAEAIETAERRAMEAARAAAVQQAQANAEEAAFEPVLEDDEP